VVEHPCYEDPVGALRALVGDSPLGTDSPAGYGREVSAEILPLRYVLDPDAIERYRRVGADAAAVSEAAASARPQTDEREAAANLEAACRRRGMLVPVLLAASERRMGLYRHPIPRGDALGRRAMLVVCAERGGLYANLTSVVDFEKPSRETARQQQACDAVLQRMREEATRPGRTLAEALSDCRSFYADEGFPDGWRDNHQGGMTGYASREVVATPQTRQGIEVGQAFAWNPSLRGAKAEETFILTENGTEAISGS
jgi:Xaa-Pro dipeptidase